MHLTDGGEACNECESCQSFNENRSYSIHELDAASNNSVDDIRTLTEQVRIPPQVGTYSIYIIDEVHMLSQSAFNAFLKTLEEPPGHAVFILATTEKHKIIPTILSRCQIFDFNRISVGDAAGYLKMIAVKESMEYEEDALHMIAHKADGAMRDALSIFDQVVSFSGKKITYKDVIKNLNILDYEYFFRLTASLLDGDTAAALLLFNEILAKGFDARNFINGYAAHLRDLMVCKNPETVQLLEVGAGIKEKYLSQSGVVPLSFLFEGLDICNQADIQFRASRNQRLTIELALVKLSNLIAEQKKKSITEPSANPAPSETTDVNTISDQAKTGKVLKSSISIKNSLQAVREGTEDDSSEHDAELADQADLPVEEATVDPDSILKAWNDYADSIEHSLPRIYSTLKYNRPVVKPDGTVAVLLNSEAQHENFIKNIKSGLLDYIIRATGFWGLEIQTEVAAVEQNGNKIYTVQDKLDYLMKKNPELGKLKAKFNLDFDE